MMRWSMMSLPDDVSLTRRQRSYSPELTFDRAACSTSPRWGEGAGSVRCSPVPDLQLHRLRGGFRQRHHHLDLDARAGRAELVDAQRRARRTPVAEIAVHGAMKAVE